MNRHNKGNTENTTRSRSKPAKEEIRPDAEVKPSRAEDEVLDVIEGVELQLGALRNAHAEHRTAMNDLVERRRKIEEQAEELETLETELGHREVELAEMRQEFEQRECNLVQRAQGLEQRESKLASQAEALEREEAQVESTQKQVKERLAEIDEQLGALRTQKSELEALETEAREKLEREEIAAAQVVEIQERLKSTESKLRGREIELGERSKVIEELAEQTGSLDTELNEVKQDLANAISQAQEQLLREQKVSDGLRAQLEQLADEGVDAKELQEKIGVLTSHLEQAKTELLEVRNQAKHSQETEKGKISDLTSQLKAEKLCVSELNKQLSESSKQIEHLDTELKQTKAQLAQAPSGKAMGEANATIEELRGQLDEFAKMADEELTGERTKAEKLKGELEKMGKDLKQIAQERDTANAELASRADVGEKELKQLHARNEQSDKQIKSLTAQLDQLTEQHKDLVAMAAKKDEELDESTETILKLEEQSSALFVQIEELNTQLQTERDLPKGVDVDEWNTHRRARLSSVRQALKANSDKIRRATDALRDRYEQCEQVLIKRAELAEAYQAIADAQAKQSRQEVRSGLYLGMAGVGMLVLVIAAISWFVSGRIAPGEFATRVTVVADAGNRTLTDADLASWGTYMESLTSDPQFVEFAAERMKRRGIMALGVPGELSREMRESLDVISPMPGSIELEYRGEGAERSQRILDTYAVALTSAANNARARRSDGATATLPKQAIASDQPTDTTRIKMAGMVFGGSMLGSLLLGGLLWTRLSAAKSRFEQDSRIEPLLDDSQWQMPGS